MVVFGDWDGDDKTFDGALEKAFEPLRGGTEFFLMIKDLTQLALATTRGENKTRPITLDDAVKVKVGCDTYLRLKAAQHARDRIRESGNDAAISQTSAPGGRSGPNLGYTCALDRLGGDS
jgi:hypothetical protein